MIYTVIVEAHEKNDDVIYNARGFKTQAFIERWIKNGSENHHG